MSDGPICIALGNHERGDDGLGRAVAEALRERDQTVDIRELHGGAAELIEAWREVDSVIVIDAACDGRPAGSIQRYDLGNELPRYRDERSSTHGLGLGEAVELAAALGRLPERLVAITVSAEHFQLGTSLSAAVASAVPAVVDRIVQEYHSMREQRCTKPR